MNEKKIKKPKNYINNAALLKELEISNQQNKMTNALVEMLKELTYRYSQIPRFVNYTYNEDMQAFALLIIAKVWKSFDATKSQNPFAYFTQTIKRAFFQFDNLERKQRDIRDALLVDGGQNPSFSYSDRYSDDGDGNEQVNSNYGISNDDFFDESNISISSNVEIDNEI